MVLRENFIMKFNPNYGGKSFVPETIFRLIFLPLNAKKVVKIDSMVYHVGEPYILEDPGGKKFWKFVCHTDLY